MFQFRHFHLDDIGATMKLGTDAVLLGVLAAPGKTPHYILDIGTGSGIIALMLAQRFPDAFIDAIDIDKETTAVAARNFEQSPWSQQLKAYHLSLQEMQTNGDENNGCPRRQYDLIVSNPPYFSKSLKNESLRKRIARHDDTLSLKELFEHAYPLLSTNGTLALILPIEQHEHALTLAHLFSLQTWKCTTIHNRLGDPAKRVVLNFRKDTGTQSEEISCERLIMRNADNSYSDSYIALTADFYLWLHK